MMIKHNNNIRHESFLKGILKLILVYQIIVLFSGSSIAQMRGGNDTTKFIGAGMYRGQTPQDFLPGFDTYFTAQYIEGAFWNRCEPEKGKFNFNIPQSWANPAGQYDWAKANKKIVYAHAITWSDKFVPEWWWQLPTDQKRQELERWIERCLDEFKDARYVNVLNEAIHSARSKEPILEYIKYLYGDNELYGTGYDWAVWIFEKAQKYKRPGQKLIINEYNFRYESIVKYSKLCKILNDRGLIDGIGIQGHYGTWRELTNEQINQELDMVSNIGVDIYITEFDVDEPDDEIQLQAMKRGFPLFWNHKNVKGLMFYDWLEGHTWRKNTSLVRKNGSERLAFQWLRSLPGISWNDRLNQLPR